MSDLIRILLSMLASAATLLTFWRNEDVHLTRIQYSMVGAILFTAAIHLLAGPKESWLFLNGMGFMALLLVLYFVSIPRLQLLTAWGLAGYTLLTIALYFVVHPWGMNNGRIDWLGLLTKLDEVAILGLLWLDKHRISQKAVA